jgi:hypothetical protein
MITSYFFTNPTLRPAGSSGKWTEYKRSKKEAIKTAWKPN